MRPCANCGTPIANNRSACDDCQKLPELLTKTSRNDDAPGSMVDDDDRRDIHKFLWWAFGLLVVLFPVLGFFLGGVVIALIFGFLGVWIFAMLEKLTH